MPSASFTGGDFEGSWSRKQAWLLAILALSLLFPAFILSGLAIYNPGLEPKSLVAGL